MRLGTRKLSGAFFPDSTQTQRTRPLLYERIAYDPRSSAITNDNDVGVSEGCLESKKNTGFEQDLCHRGNRLGAMNTASC